MLRKVQSFAVSIVILIAGCASTLVLASGAAAAATIPHAISGCGAIEKAHPSLEGKSLVDAISPFNPGYEAINPKKPGTYQGFDIDLLGEMGSCLGFTVTYKSLAFAALLPTLQSGQANLVMSSLYATPARAVAANFATYESVADAVLVTKSNPGKITGYNLSICGKSAAEVTGYVETLLIQSEGSKCKAAGKPAPSLQQYSTLEDCILAVENGRADTFLTGYTGALASIKADPILHYVARLTLPYSIAVAVPKSNNAELLAFQAALLLLQKDGKELALLKKWGLPANSLEASTIVR